MSNYDIKKFQSIVNRSLSDASQKNVDDFNKIIYWHEDTIEKVPYSINSYGYRSKEFDKNNEVLVLGCSHTYGSGLPDEFTWPIFFSNSINKKYSRLASQGDSIGGQVYKAFKYFEEIGNPKIVLGLFPLYRLEYIAIPGEFMVYNKRAGNREKDKISIEIAYFYEDYLLKISKKPHDPEYMIPKDFVLFYNFMFIKMLEQYCESNNIKFIWSIYDDKDIDLLIQSTPSISKNYLQTSDISRGMGCSSDKSKCPSKEFLNHVLHDNAADYDPSKGFGHWGIHMHRHIAERFLTRYRKIEND